MTDWIDELRERHDSSKAKQHTADELKLRKDDLIRSKGPDAWSDLMKRIDADCDKLNLVFADERDYQVQYQGGQRQMHLSSRRVRPHRQLDATLDKSDLFVKIDFRTVDEERQISHRRGEIRFELSPGDNLVLNFEGCSISEDISQRLIRWVCDSSR